MQFSPDKIYCCSSNEMVCLHDNALTHITGEPIRFSNTLKEAGV